MYTSKLKLSELKAGDIEMVTKVAIETRFNKVYVYTQY